MTDFHQRAIKAWQTRHRQGEGSEGTASRGDWVRSLSSSGKTTVAADPEILSQLLPGATEDDLRALAMAQPDSKVTVRTARTGAGRLRVVLTAEGDGVKTLREIRRLASGGRYMNNVYVKMEDRLRGRGLGTKLFKAQVDAAQKAGLRAIVADCSRSDLMNGYYTWARLGFDGLAANPRAGVFSGDKVRIAEQMRTPEGRREWMRHGAGFAGTFDLRPGSYSMRTLDAYVRAKGRA